MDKRRINGGQTYLVNFDGEVIHRYPAFEQCNTDDIVHKGQRTGTQLLTEPDRMFSNYAMCEHCFK